MDEIISLPGGGIKISSASWRDINELHSLEKTCFQGDAWPLLDVLGVLTFPQIIRLKASAENSLVGFIALDLRQAQKTAWIATLAVAPDFRRQGIGTALLQLGESKVNLPRLKLSVRQSNQAAISLYRNHGYHQVDVWESYYRGGDNALVLEKLVPSAP